MADGAGERALHGAVAHAEPRGERRAGAPAHAVGELYELGTLVSDLKVGQRRHADAYAHLVTTPTPNTTPAPLDDASRAAILNAEVARYANQGWTVSSVSAGQGVLQRKKRIGWFWNLILTIITAGLWLIVIIIRVVNRKIETRIVRVDAYGRVSVG